jgi:hypothetical protein
MNLFILTKCGCPIWRQYYIETNPLSKDNNKTSEQILRQGASQETPPHTFLEAIKQCFKKYANFKGRAMRWEFWYFALFVWGINTICFIIIALLSDKDNYDCISIVSISCSLHWLLLSMVLMG